MYYSIRARVLVLAKVFNAERQGREELLSETGYYNIITCVHVWERVSNIVTIVSIGMSVF